MWRRDLAAVHLCSASDLQKEALFSALSALSVFKASTLIILYVPPTFRSTLNAYDYHYSQQRHLSCCNKFSFLWGSLFPPMVSVCSTAHTAQQLFVQLLCSSRFMFYLAGSDFCPTNWNNWGYESNLIHDNPTLILCDYLENGKQTNLCLSASSSEHAYGGTGLTLKMFLSC